jgi:hypothetical protein
MTSALLKPPSILYSSPMMSSAGVTMVDAKGDKNVKQDTMIVTVHLRRESQFSGHAGSNSPSHVTYVWSARGSSQ